MNALQADLLQKAQLLLERPDLKPNPDDLLHRLPGWDSLRMMTLLMQIEKERKLRFQAAEVARLKTWSDLVAMVEKSAGERKDP